MIYDKFYNSLHITMTITVNDFNSIVIILFFAKLLDFSVIIAK